ncbi:hypothetical protein [Sutcliffiella horikoshii]|uniref:Uncharacterized protein n=1 Tax=Sutcliffiella horikoshii TaxID=79883 RepID=A0A5D4TFZ2_9BACI|nr:hypothetical protein [Sutcliffiella horikoshii]TYS74527.1 hypothetical protein FZC75_02180 [Sutcliffiella horikoshii]
MLPHAIGGQVDAQKLNDNFSYLDEKTNFTDNIKQFNDISQLSTSTTESITSTNRHYPTLLNTPTYDGSGEVVHPDVIYIENGFGSEKWRYWMAMTPMPNRDERFENPSVIASHDGITWEVPTGLVNPIVPAPVDIDDHNSDTDMVFYDNQLWLYYRETKRSATPREQRIKMTKSSDGVNWSTPTVAILDASGRSDALLSPSVIHKNGLFHMWVVDGYNNLVKATSANGTNFSNFETCTTIGMPSGRGYWHIDVTANEYRLEMLLNSTSATSGVDGRLQYAYSLDDGLTWHTDAPFIERIYDFEQGRHYRGSIRAVKDNPNLYEIWYSSLSDENRYRVAYLNAVRIENKLYPITPSDLKWISFYALSVPSVNAGTMSTQKLVVGGEDATSRLKRSRFVNASLQSGWNNNPDMTTRYYKEGDHVHLMGRVVNGTSTDGTLIFTLEVDYRPIQDMIFRQRHADVYIQTDGTVTIYSYSGTYVAFDGIVFRTE